MGGGITLGQILGPILFGGSALGVAGAGAYAISQADTDDGLIFYRRGPRDTRELMQSQATLAEEKLGIFGLSTSLSPAARPGQMVRSATEQEVLGAGFTINKTGGPNHYTIGIPKPVTTAVANTWNGTFK